MDSKRIISLVMALLFFACLAGADGGNGFIQREQLKRLSPKYRAFLAETRDFIHPEERRVFLGLETDEQRDTFIQKFWEARRGWDNISTLYLLRMVQALDLSEGQTAKIFPKVNGVEKEKREINRKTGLLLRELRARVRQQDGNEKELLRIMDEIKVLRDRVETLDEELQSFMEENLTVHQLAKYLIFHQDFVKDLREKLTKAREAIK